MERKQNNRVEPSPARMVMGECVAFYLCNGGPEVARLHLDRLANELKFYGDCSEAYREASATITRTEQENQLKAEQRMKALFISIMKSNDPPPPKANRPGIADATPPPILSTPKAKQMWQKLRQHGLVDDHYQPCGLSRTEAALLADEMATRLGISHKWKTFEKQWQRNNMRADYNDALDQKKTSNFRDRLKQILD